MNARRYGIKSLLTVHREERIFPEYKRSKYISITTQIKALAVHYPKLCKKNGYNYTVPTVDAVMQHYRTKPILNADNKTVHDDSMLHYKDDILQRIVNRHQNFSDFL